MECTPARGPGCVPFNQTDKNPWGDPYRFRVYGSLQGFVSFSCLPNGDPDGAAAPQPCPSWLPPWGFLSFLRR